MTADSNMILTNIVIAGNAFIKSLGEDTNGGIISFPLANGDWAVLNVDIISKENIVKEYQDENGVLSIEFDKNNLKYTRKEL